MGNRSALLIASVEVTRDLVRMNSEKGAITMYDQFAAQANMVGDSSRGAAFTDFRRDEQGHLKAFTDELNQVKH